MDLLTLASHGFGQHDLAMAVLRAAVGVFFAISGYHKLFDTERHKHLVDTLVADHVPAVRFNQWWVPCWEFASGICVAVGFFTAFNAAVLIAICIVACLCEARSRVAAYRPIDAADAVDDYLYLPEVLYLLMLDVVLLSGAGPYSVDALLFPM